METARHIIDCSAQPYIPYGCKLISHRECGQIVWNPAEIDIVIPDAQKNLELMELPRGWGTGTGQTHEWRVNTEKLYQEMEEKAPFNANMLDFLLAHPNLIPEEWKKHRAIRFWGTVYSCHGRFVRYLRWRAKKWDWYYTYIDGGISFDAYRRWYPAAIPKNKVIDPIQ